MKPHVFIIVLVAALAGGLACDRSNPAPVPTAPTPTPTSPPVAVAPSLVRITITGTSALTAVGETSALTATATYSDASTKAVTNDVVWSSTDPSSIAISSTGVLTVMRFGTSYILARYLSKSVTANVRATPPGTFIVAGRVREPGSGGIENARVLELASGLSTMSLGGDFAGQYSVGGLTNARLVVDKEGYERITIDATPNGSDDVPMQRLVRIARGENVSSTIAPNDMDYRSVPNSPCYPCRLIRVTGAQAGELQLRVTWTEPHSTLNVWVDGRLFAGTARGPSEIVADMPVVAGELLVYVGLTGPSQYYVPFTLSTVAVK